MNELTWLRNLKISNKRGNIVPFVPHYEQMALLRAMFRQEAAGHPSRILVLKARQVGITTLMQGEHFRRCWTIPHREALTAAHTTDDTQKIFRKVKFMEEQLPEWLKRPMEFSSKRELLWGSPHRSHQYVETANKPTLGRGGTLQDFHGSEVAFWPVPQDALLSVENTMGDIVGTSVVLESTANGMGNEFHRRWLEAVDQQEKGMGLAGYQPLFFSWLSFKEYTRTAERPKTPGARVRNLDAEERELQRLGANEGQLRWRRHKIATACAGDPVRFAQENPATWQQAFMVTGRPVLPLEVIRHHQLIVRDGQRFTLSWANRKERKVRVEDGSSKRYYWEIWHKPHPNFQYTVAADVAEGILSDMNNSNSDPDHSAIVVYNRHLNRVDAVWRGQVPPDELGDLLAIAATWYNNAWCTPEINGPGFGTLARLKQYRGMRIYNRQRWEDKRAIDRTDYLGWRTTPSNRDVMIDDYVAAVRPDAKGNFDTSLNVYSKNLLDEEQTFVWKPNGKREHASSKHDDELFALMIAYQLHKRCPTWGTLQLEQIDARKPKLAYEAMLRPGGYDPGVMTEERQIVPQTR